MMQSESTERVVIPRSVAQTAFGEIETLIHRSGGHDADSEEACTPLALVRQRVVDDDDLDDAATEAVLQILQDVAGERNVDLSGTDPLVDQTFRAQKALKRALEADSVEYLVAGDTTADEEDIHHAELHDIAHGMVTSAFIFDTEERGLTGFKVNADDIEWCDFTRATEADGQ